jgi:chorismate synthase
MNTFGQLFRVTTFGESHGGSVGVVIDGCPAGLKLDVKDFKQDLDRRRTGQSSIVSARKEEDTVEILSGVFEGKTLGTPIALMVRNKDARSKDYKKMKDRFRPSHADFTYEAKYGIRNWAGGGRASARETTARVMAGVVAKKLLKDLSPASLNAAGSGKNLSPASLNAAGSLLKRREAKVPPMEVLAYVDQVGEMKAEIDPMKVTLKKVEANAVRCPDAKAAVWMIDRIKEVQKSGDTIGGTVTCVVKNVPVGLGDPVFAKLKATLAQAMMSLPATMGVEFGSGFGSLGMLGSEHNDIFEMKGKKVVTQTNHSGGIQGGISNGMPIVFRTVFKPVSTIFKEQKTVTNKGKAAKILMPGRHDPCVVPRAVVMVEAMTAIVLADHLLRKRSSQL